MIRPLLALVILALFASDSFAQCGARRQPVRNLFARIRPANHAPLFPRLAQTHGCPAGVCAAGSCATGACATGACANGSCPAPGATVIGQTGPGVLGSTPSTFRIVPLAK